MPPKEDTLIGHQVGRYMIQGFLREDRLGRVYLAHELPGKKKVDVKVLDPAYASNDELFGRFGREMLATATINHPNSVQMLDFGDHRKLFHYIVLEHVEAITLADEIKAHKKLPWERAARIAHQVANALQAAHAEKIIHRNLNPANLLLLENADGDFVKIRDFGLARLVDPDNPDAAMLTAVGTRVGQAEYMAPEYISVGIVHRRGDLYALGIVLYEMLTGAPPYTGKTHELLDKHLTAETPRVKDVVKVPAWLDELVYKLMSKEMNNRPADAGEVARALEQGLGKPVELPELTQETKRRSTQAPAGGGMPLNQIALVAGFATIALVCIALGLAIGLVMVGP